MMKATYIQPNAEICTITTEVILIKSGSDFNVNSFTETTQTIGDDDEEGANSMNTSLWEDE